MGRSIKPSGAKRKVHITDHNGNLVFNRLIDVFSNVFSFDSGFGFVDREFVKKSNYIVKPGWR